MEWIERAQFWSICVENEWMNVFSANDFTLLATVSSTTGNQESLEKFPPEI